MESAGLHIIMDAKVKDASVFTADSLRDMFERLVEALGMQALGDLIVYDVPVDPAVLERVKATGIFEDEGGISTVQVISTSHCSLHAWPLQKYYAADLFSCKDFDAEVALKILRDTLGVVAENTLVIKRKKPGFTSNVRHIEV